MSPDQRRAARARCDAGSDGIVPKIAAEIRVHLLNALDALDAADQVVVEGQALIHALAERVHSQSEKLSRRAERQMPR
jgi:hypothetical protein